MLEHFAGNETVKTALSGMLLTGRIPHAVILEGEPGLGKRTLADFISAAALCTGAPVPCGVCRDCALSAAGHHPDLTVISPTGKSIPVDTVRGVQQNAYVMPHQSVRRVFLFSAADSMTEQAQNALLKVLEEPPSYAMFLLLTASAARLLPTLRSRSVVFSLSPPDPEEAAAAILRIRPECGAEAAERAARQTGGNIGRALALLESGETSSADRTASELLALTASDSELALLKALTPFERDRASTQLLLEALLTALQGALIDKSAGKASPDMPFTRRRLMKMAKAVQGAQRALEGNGNLPLLLTNLCACFKAAARL